MRILAFLMGAIHHNDLRSTYQFQRERHFGDDSMDRLIKTTAMYPGNPTLSGATAYTLNGVHNRTAVTLLSGEEDTGAAVGSYTMDGVQEFLNQFTTVPSRPSGDAKLAEYKYFSDDNENLGAIVEHPRPCDFNGDYIADLDNITAFTTAFQDQNPSADLNGVYDRADVSLFTDAYTNAPAGGFYHAMVKYDERNQLVGFEARRGGTLLGKSSYRYDAFNRRVASFADVDGDGNDDVVTYHVYGGQAAWQMLAEYDGADDAANLLRSYVYGLYIDEVLSMRDHASDDDYFYHQDDLFSVYALTDADGAVVERYDYGDYGQVSIMEANGTPRAESAYDNRHAFTGRLLMPELTLDDGGQILEYRHRYMHTASGRFVQRDPLGYMDGMNLYEYGMSQPYLRVDPYGLSCASCDGSPVGGRHDQCTSPIQEQIWQIFVRPHCRLVENYGLIYIKCDYNRKCVDVGMKAAVACCEQGCGEFHNCLGQAISSVLNCDTSPPPEKSPARERKERLPPEKPWWQRLACQFGSNSHCQQICQSPGSGHMDKLNCQDMCACLAGAFGRGVALSACNVCCDLASSEAEFTACFMSILPGKYKTPSDLISDPPVP